MSVTGKMGMRPISLFSQSLLGFSRIPTAVLRINKRNNKFEILLGIFAQRYKSDYSRNLRIDLMAFFYCLKMPVTL